MRRCFAFIRLLLLDDDGPAHHDCRLRVLAAAGASKELSSADMIDCSNWRLEQLEEWGGEGGLIELSKVVKFVMLGGLGGCFLVLAPFFVCLYSCFRSCESFCRRRVTENILFPMLRCCASCSRAGSTQHPRPTWSFRTVFNALP